ncbi:hypothetical protein GOB57_07800 [Sinorhizobium meliloti]|nr:hypothetical protein [Sinorhizobium meliloti]
MSGTLKIVTGSLAALILGLFVASRFVSVFVIQPIGAIPDGVTVVITRLENVNFIDSPDAICERRMGGVSLLCRGMVAGRVASEADILMRLPYSSLLYAYTTGHEEI